MAVVRKIIAYLLFLMSVFIPPRADKLIMTAISATPSCVVIECENKTGRKLLMDNTFTVEKQVGEEWSELRFCDGFDGFKEISFDVLPTEKAKLKIDTAYCFGSELESGTYRVNVSAYMYGYGEITSSTQFDINV